MYQIPKIRFYCQTRGISGAWQHAASAVKFRYLSQHWAVLYGQPCGRCENIQLGAIAGLPPIAAHLIAGAEA